ncbi:MAG TPA: hypothetical protein ENH20_00995 [Candidatus Pacearchaeota archaeon]|nr:hypothetical protein [Candidatus Pacearchaeota archaeon]
MRQDNKMKVLEVFYEAPEKVFTVREVAKVSGVARATVHKILVELKRDGMISEDGRANLDSKFLIRKVHYFVEKIVNSGLVDFLVERFIPSSIVLFGSVAKGDSVKGSDVDIFVESQIDDADGVAMGLNLRKFERKIGHKIELFVKSNIGDYHDNLFNNIVNGVKLYGSVKVK